ncbi:MAG: type II toxin-antitoxin system RelE/ParE family toxin [Caulobacteraceae bacterium]
MDIVRTSAFAKSIKKLGASDTDLIALENEIAADHTIGEVIPGLGVRKVRFAMKGKGKSGGGRCIYLALVTDDTAYLLLAYDKTVQTDLSTAQRKAIKDLVKGIKNE